MSEKFSKKEIEHHSSMLQDIMTYTVVYPGVIILVVLTLNIILTPDPWYIRWFGF